MSIRVRLIVALLLVGLVPMSVAVFGGDSGMTQLNDLAVRSSEAALEEMGKAAIRDRAAAVAQQVELYLRYHPDVDLSDVTALQADAELAALAVQPVGQTGYTAVFDAGAVTHFHVNPAIIGTNLSALADTLPEFWAILSASLDGSLSEGYYDWEDTDGTIRRKFMAIAPVGDTPLRVAATTYVQEFITVFEPVQVMRAQLEQTVILTRRRFGLLAAVVGLISVGVALFMGFRLTEAIRDMAVAANRVMEGEWGAIQPSDRRDELGTLNRAFYAMNQRVQELVQDLEQQVAERTADLQQRAAELEQLTGNLEEAVDESRRRALRLEASAQVAQAVASVLDPDALLNQVVDLIADRVGFYHVGIFLLDEAGQYAVLRAASSEGGRRMLTRGHRLRVGEQGIVGYVTSTGRPRIALDVGADAVHFDNPDLPQTRSEMALPLSARGHILGALDVQSLEPEAFGDEDVAVLQNLANQIAVALDNARLFEEAQMALREMQAVQAQYTRRAWRAFAAQQGGRSFEYTRAGVAPLGSASPPEVERATMTGKTVVVHDTGDGQTSASLVVPLKLHGQTVGVLGFQEMEPGRVWTQDEIALANAAAYEIVQVLESARLFEDTQQRAWREQTIGQITAEIRASTDVERILQTAAEQLGHTLGVSRAIVRLGMAEDRLPTDQKAPP